MSLDLPALAALVADHGQVVRVLVLRTAGSTPRERGTAMLVWDDGRSGGHSGGQSGTIGGGTLEWEALGRARAMLREGRWRETETLPLGPALGQCCGGAVTLFLERFDRNTLPATLPHARPLTATPAPRPARLAQALARWLPGQEAAELDGWLIEGAPAPRRPLWIWGAGHVGQALVETLAPLPHWAITWADVAPDRFPALPARAGTQVTILPAADLPRVAAHAPVDAEHLILTMSHEIDLALCHALLLRGFAACGMIGSATKRARFRSRLARLGHGPAAVARIACPIGDPALGKHPQAIAVSVAAALLLDATATAREGRAG
ncbi:MAG: xanthine dehydrogenase accessory protein XdhC [Rubellimicrobium sp.]|nr:xanthine dehydrogenase accessory protein XdhC [Rubellimicrobium sp.]